MQKRIKILTTIILGFTALHVFAKSTFEASNGDTISANISSSELTRIEIDGQRIIKDFSSADVSKKITKPLGQIYLIPNTKQTFNLYIVSDIGNTYNLKLTPVRHMSGDSIVILPKSTTKVVHNKLDINANSYVRNINYLIELMYMNKLADSQYTATTENTSIVTYKGLESVLLTTYTNDYLEGSVILLKNTSKSEIRLVESQFYTDHALAVAIENPILEPNDFTRVFIVQQSVDDEVQ